MASRLFTMNWEKKKRVFIFVKGKKIPAIVPTACIEICRFVRCVWFGGSLLSFFFFFCICERPQVIVWAQGFGFPLMNAKYFNHKSQVLWYPGSEKKQKQQLLNIPNFLIYSTIYRAFQAITHIPEASRKWFQYKSSSSGLTHRLFFWRTGFFSKGLQSKGVCNWTQYLNCMPSSMASHDGLFHTTIPLM